MMQFDDLPVWLAAPRSSPTARRHYSGTVTRPRIFYSLIGRKDGEGQLSARLGRAVAWWQSSPSPDGCKHSQQNEAGAHAQLVLTATSLKYTVGAPS